MIYADLHTHSTASDGQHSPRELVGMAKAQGIEAMALTDHDTVDGLEEAFLEGERLGLKVIGGIELSAEGYDTFHILGYGFDPQDPGLLALCRRMKTQREERNPRLIAFLREKGVAITLEEVRRVAGSDVIGRPHFARVMVAKGYTATNREAFDRYLDIEEYHKRVERQKPSAEECIACIRKAGGKVCLAHPYQIGLEDQALEALVKKLALLGLDAIECYYPRHTKAQQAFYEALAEKYSLHKTGGSDFHGQQVKPDIHLTGVPQELAWIVEK